MSRRWLLTGAAVTVAVGAFTAWTAGRYRTPDLLLPALPQTSLAILPCPSPDPMEPHRIDVDGFGSPASLREAVAQADAVIIGRRDTTAPQEVTVETCQRFTLYSFEKVEAINGSVAGRRFQVAWFGREIDEVEGFFPRPKTGQLYLLFLTRRVSASHYFPLYSPLPIALGKDGLQIATLDSDAPLPGQIERLLSYGPDFLQELRGYAEAR